MINNEERNFVAKSEGGHSISRSRKLPYHSNPTMMNFAERVDWSSTRFFQNAVLQLKMTLSLRHKAKRKLGTFSPGRVASMLPYVRQSDEQAGPSNMKLETFRLQGYTRPSLTAITWNSSLVYPLLAYVISMPTVFPSIWDLDTDQLFTQSSTMSGKIYYNWKRGILSRVLSQFNENIFLLLKLYSFFQFFIL